MPSNLPRNTLSSGTAAASTSITLLLRSSAIVPTTCPDRNSVRKNTPNTAKKPEALRPPALGAPRSEMLISATECTPGSRETRTARSASAAR